MTNLNKTEKLIAGIAFGAIAVFVFMFFQVSKSGSKLSSQFDSAHSIDYKMARPAPVYSEYTLNGREFDATYEALTPEEKKKVIAKKKLALVAKKKSEIKKAELKKKQVAQAAAKAKTLAKTRAQQMAAARESRAQTTELKKAAAVSAQTTAYNNQSFNNQTAAAAPEPEEADPKQPGKKTFAQWRALMFEKPTTETLTAFITAYRKNEVTLTEYQAMAQDLLDQSDDKLKALGLQALRSVPSFQSFSQLVHIQSSLPANQQSYVNASLAAYLQPQNLGHLNQALASSDKVVLVKALVILNESLDKLSRGDASAFSDPRSRGATTSGVTMASFRNLLPALGNLSNSQDQDLAPLAQNVMNLISQSNNVALN